MTDQTVQQRPGDSAAILALFGILAVAALLRIIGANSEFWFDEIATVINYVRPAPLEVMQN